MNAQSFKNLSPKIFDCFTVLKIHEKIENRQIFCLLLFYIVQREDATERATAKS